MRRRLILRTIGWLGAAAIAGQVAAYTWLSSQDLAGTSMRLWSARLDRGRFRVEYPNTWRLSVRSRPPAFGVLLRAPGGARVEVTGSSALMSRVRSPEAAQAGEPVALRKLHAALAAQSSVRIAAYGEDNPEPSMALRRESLVSSFSGRLSGERVRGFRYTMIGSTRVWSLVAVAPGARWRRGLPVMKRIAASVEVP